MRDVCSRLLEDVRAKRQRLGVRAMQAIALVLLLGGASHGSPQLGQRHQIPAGVDFGQQEDDFITEKRLNALNAERQKSLVADTNKLLKLATEVEKEIGKNQGDSSLAEQLRKIAEIEKLARSVKEKMSTSVRNSQVFQQPSPFPPRN